VNIPGTYPGEYPILAVWCEGGHIHARWSAWTVHVHQDKPDKYLLRHVEGFEPPFKTRECEIGIPPSDELTIVATLQYLDRRLLPGCHGSESDQPRMVEMTQPVNSAQGAVKREAFFFQTSPL
jgi:hypothetical protein